MAPSMNSLPASERCSESSLPRCWLSGSSRPPTGTITSPVTPRRSREVARAHTWGSPARGRRPATRTRRRGAHSCRGAGARPASHSWVTSTSTGSRPGAALSPSVPRTAPGTRPGSERPDKSTKNTPPGRRSATCRPISMARRVLPHPPGPTKLTSRSGRQPAADRSDGGLAPDEARELARQVP